MSDSTLPKDGDWYCLVKVKVTAKDNDTVEITFPNSDHPLKVDWRWNGAFNPKHIWVSYQVGGEIVERPQKDGESREGYLLVNKNHADTEWREQSKSDPRVRAAPKWPRSSGA